MKSIPPRLLPVLERPHCDPRPGLAAVAMLLAILVLPGTLRSAPPAATPPVRSAPAPATAKGFDAFRRVRLLNIFDPERRGMRRDSNSDYQPRPRDSIRPRRGGGDYFALTGTMVTEQRQLAFFTGSQSDFNKVISAQGKIGNYTITNISSSHVDLQEEGKPPLVLVVGKQLALDGSGIKAYEPPAPVEVASETPPGTPAAASSDNGPDGSGDDGPPNTPPAAAAAPGSRFSTRSTPSAPTAAADSGDKSELIKRMMERAANERK